MRLREYQSRTIDELWSWFLANKTGNPIVEAAVGSGKSVLIAALCRRAMTEYPGTRILMVAHQKELLSQNIDKIRRIWPSAPLGIWSAAVGHKRLGDVTFATIGSVYKDAHLLGKTDLLLADEAHLINPKEAGMWRKLVTDLRRYGSPDLRVIGFTATPWRGNGVWLTDGEDPLFTHIASRVTMTELLELGYLAPLVPASTKQLISTEGVKTVNGDYDVKELEQRAGAFNIVQAAADETIRLGQGRRRWLGFCVTIKHAEEVAMALRHRGIAAQAVHGDTTRMPQQQRDRLMADFRAGRLRCLVNVAVATTGLDVPEIDFIFLLRPTKSLVLYPQIMGRGARLIGQTIVESITNGKADCLVADFTSTIKDLGPVDAIKGRKATRKGNKPAPFKVCDNCGSQCPTATAECPACGFKFPPPDNIVHGIDASGAAVLSSQLVDASPVKSFRVTGVAYHLVDDKAGSTGRRILVSYYDGLKTIAKEHVYFERDGFLRRKAQNWWFDRVGGHDTPKTAEEAKRALEWLKVRGMLREPVEVSVDMSSKWKDLVHVTHRATNEQAGTASQDQPVQA